MMSFWRQAKASSTRWITMTDPIVIDENDVEDVYRDGRVRDADTVGADTRSEAETPTVNGAKSGLHDPDVVVSWVRDNQPAGRAEIVAEFHDDSLPVNEKTWWENYARESLKEAGFEFVRNQGWQELD